MALAVSKRFGSGSAVVTAEINNWPNVLGLTTTDGQIAPGDSTSFTVVAVDPDDDHHLRLGRRARRRIHPRSQATAGTSPGSLRPARLSPPYRVSIVVEAMGLPTTGSLVTPLTFAVSVACP